MEYELIEWKNLKYGNLVYERGFKHGEVYFYGPYHVINVERRILENRKGKQFMHYPNDLYKEK
jgi:hypothetical protein